MPTRLSREYYRDLANYDLRWLRRQKHSIARMHVIQVVKASKWAHYDAVAAMRDILCNRTCSCGGWKCERCKLAVKELRQVMQKIDPEGYLSGDPK